MQGFDVVVVGSGMAGFTAATKAASLGASVALIERSELGGTCINHGCFPTKALLRSAELIGYARQSERFGFRAGPIEVDFPALMAMKNRVVEAIVRDLEATLASYPKLVLVRGQAMFQSPRELEVAGKVIQADRIVLGAGSKPFIPAIKGLDSTPFLSNKELLQLASLPASLLIIGGGAVAVEFAQMFARFGTEVTLLQRGERILPSEEPEAALMLTDYLRDEGITILTHADTTEVGPAGSGVRLVASVAGEDRVLEAEHLLVATGRVPDLEALRLDQAGIEVRRNKIVVDRLLRTSAPNIWCLGDAAGGPLLAHYATFSAEVVAENALLGTEKEIPESVIPGAVFTLPNLASVGLTEQAAIAAGHQVRTGTMPFTESSKSRIYQETKGFIKWVVEVETERILGAHILGFHAADLLQEVVVAMSAPGGTVEPIINALHVHPSMGESVHWGAVALRHPFRHTPVG